ncbi:MAG TPA: DinB family protein, partial [Chthonomonadales bacterium]|nr:DinB family protein [Chthonomonadales bacterium]
MTVFEFQARRIERIAKAVAHFVDTTDPSRLDWRPPCEGGIQSRSVLDQLAEIILVNRYFTSLLRGETPESSTLDRESPTRPFTTVEEGKAQLLTSAGELSDTIRSLDESMLTRTYSHRRGPVSGENLLEMPYRNMAYHAGQINFIQTLAGDPEFHVPPTW